MQISVLNGYKPKRIAILVIRPLRTLAFLCAKPRYMPSITGDIFMAKALSKVMLRSQQVNVKLIRNGIKQYCGDDAEVIAWHLAPLSQVLQRVFVCVIMNDFCISKNF